MHLDSTDRKLLNLVQAEFPLTPEPYSDLGLRLGIDRDAIMGRIAQLRAGGIIREISPVLETRSLGYRTTLVAMRVADNHLDKAERLIAEHPGVSHGYEREHYFNLWFTFAAPAGVDLEAEIQHFTSPIEAEAAFPLPAKRVFKIDAYFDMGGDGQRSPAAQSVGAFAQQVELSSMERLVLNELQQDLPHVPRPFTAMAARLGMDVEGFLAQCHALQKRGIIRRFGASIDHRKAGFKANAMACWVTPPELVDAAGRKLASLREVSHCYERATNHLWHYNLFAMIHSRTREACRAIASRVSLETGLRDCVLLFSTREFKKTRIRYLV